jgi:hypothetical protein
MITVTIETRKIKTIGYANNFTLRPTLKAYDSSQLFKPNPISGIVTTPAIRVTMAKSLDNNTKMFWTEAPNTFRIPISFARCKVV